jgi:glycosyltransferase involved in cell wall biosynthesis
MPIFRRALYVTPFALLPKTEGHRKRMAMTFEKLVEQGFQVDVLFISREYDWSDLFNRDVFRELQALGDVFHYVHAATPGKPAKEFYALDEWWPDQATEYCEWLFANNGYEIIFCNYIFMSRVFELCRRPAVKIVDTHDMFAGRHKLLMDNGLTPEFFYTDRRSEAAGLDRADVAIAIKDEEAEEFRRISDPRVITLPYVEDVSLDMQVTPRSDEDGVVKFGFFGSANSINVKNIVEFIRYLEEVRPPAGYAFELWLYGSLCRRLKGPVPDYVKLGGMVPTTADFYGAVDCVVNPQYFSTGLKIKIAEALAFGAPLISHRHSFEGFGKPLDPAHDCQDFAGVVAQMRGVVEDRARLLQLAEASRDVQRRQTLECDRQWTRILRGALVKSRWLYLFVRVDCFNKVRFYRHLVELVFATFGNAFMICMVGDHENDRDTLWRGFKRKANRYGVDVTDSQPEADAIFIVFDDPYAWGGIVDAGRYLTIFEDAARMVAGHQEQPWRGWSGAVRPEWVVVRSDKASAAPAHAATDSRVNYFRWMPWDMSVVATGDQFDRASETWVLTGPDVSASWRQMAQRIFKDRTVRFFSEGRVEGADDVAGGAFDLMRRVFSQKTVPMVVISLNDDDGFAPMKAWFIANGIAVKSFAPYVVADARLSPAEALGLPRLSQFAVIPDKATSAEIVASAWVGSGWRRLNDILTTLAEGPPPDVSLGM